MCFKIKLRTDVKINNNLLKALVSIFNQCLQITIHRSFHPLFEKENYKLKSV